jgi:hypothetical protein
MATVKFSPIVSEIHGSIGNLTFQSCRSGNIVRIKPLPYNPNTSYQQARRVFMNYINSEWSSLTDNEKNIWQLLADFYTAKSGINQKVRMSARQFWLHYHLLSFPQHSVPLDDPAFVRYLQQGVATSLGYSGVNLMLSFSDDLNWADLCCNVSLSYPFYTSQFVPSLIFKSIILPEIEQAHFDITSLYLAAFGVLPLVSQLVYIKYVVYSAESPQAVLYPVDKLTVYSP